MKFNRKVLGTSYRIKWIVSPRALPGPSGETIQSYSLKSYDQQELVPTPLQYCLCSKVQISKRESLTYRSGVGFLPPHQPCQGEWGRRVQTWTWNASPEFHDMSRKTVFTTALKPLWAWLSIISAKGNHWDMWPRGFEKCILLPIRELRHRLDRHHVTNWRLISCP